MFVPVKTTAIPFGRVGGRNETKLLGSLLLSTLSIIRIPTDPVLVKCFDSISRLCEIDFAHSAGDNSKLAFAAPETKNEVF
jgi:hypothetical protein